MKGTKTGTSFQQCRQASRNEVMGDSMWNETHLSTMRKITIVADYCTTFSGRKSRHHASTHVVNPAEVNRHEIIVGIGCRATFSEPKPKLASNNAVKPAETSRHKIIVGIDYGTTFSRRKGRVGPKSLVLPGCNIEMSRLSGR
jgi:hypothetical protein